MKHEYKDLGFFKNDFIESNNYNSSTPGVLFTDTFIKDKLIDGFEQLGFKVDKESYFNFIPKTKIDEHNRPFKISLELRH